MHVRFADAASHPNRGVRQSRRVHPPDVDDGFVKAVEDRASRSIELVNLDTQWSDPYREHDIESRTFAPGRYELRYVGGDEFLPENQDVLVGCVTIEG